MGKSKNEALIKHRLSKNFKRGGKWYLVYCPQCEMENYGPAVSSGRCAWCGFDMNKEIKELRNDT